MPQLSTARLQGVPQGFPEAELKEGLGSGHGHPIRPPPSSWAPEKVNSRLQSTMPFP